ncbi:MAG: TonB-dependent receptor domain-containing protein [Pseudomonadota bacterium]
MTKRPSLRMLLLFAALATATGAHAKDGENDAVNGAGARPLEEILEGLRQSEGFAFIFDSRLVEGKMAPPVEPTLPPEARLNKQLDAVSLRLHKVAPKTFAITKEPSLAGSSPAAANDIGADGEVFADTILVLGSTPIANMTAGSKRIFNIDADDLAYLSVTSPAEAIYDLPQSLASFTPANTALYGATAGISLADLRGLDPKRTMVLLNGRRRTLTTGGNSNIGGVDLNSVAEPFLERIEVQSLPGGARYGAGAVAGTINFVTKSGVDGLEAGARLGISEQGDSEEISLHAIGGRRFDGFGEITIGINVTRNEGLIGADREFSATPYGFGLNGRRSNPPSAQFLPGYGGSSITDRGLFGGVILADGSFAPLPNGRTYVPQPGGAIAPFVAALDQLYNWVGWQSMILPNDRILGMLSFNRDISDNWRLFAEAQAGLSATDNLLAPLPAGRSRGVDPIAGDAAVIPLDNPTLPQAIRDLALANFGASAVGVVFDHRYAELGPRRHQIDRRYVDIAAGVETASDEGANFALSYRFAHNRVVTRDRDRIDHNRLEIALHPALCAATPGCSPVDYFTTPELSREALDYIVIPEIRRTTAIEEHEIAAAYGRPLRFSDGIDGTLALGVEFRRAILTDRDEIPAGAAPIGYLGGADNAGSMNSFEAYAEIESPLFRFDQFPGEVAGSLAFRTTKSSRFDYSMNFEAGVDWRPIEGVNLFMRRHIGERTPDLIELFSIGPTLENAYFDPCGVAPDQQSPVVQANCASGGPFGVGAGFTQLTPLASGTFYGNPDIEPEKVRSAAYGAALALTELFTQIPGRMEVAATWLDFEINDAISQFGDVLEACYSSPGFESPACGVNPRTGLTAIVRDPVSRQVVSIDGVLQNIGRLKWSGLDLELRYAVEPERIPLIDSLWLSALHTYTDRVELWDGYGAAVRMDGLINYPNHRTLLSAGAASGRWSLAAYANRRGRVRTIRLDVPEAKIPAALYLDTTIRFDVTDQAYIQASVQNITDKEPAITAFNAVGNFAPEFYDPIGRRYSLSVRLSF